MNTQPNPKCPSCGFTVFNRRYPNCERCKQLLPRDVVYSSEEVAALQASEKTAELARRAQGRAASSSEDADADWDYSSASEGGAGDCSVDGGSCGGGDW